MPDSRHKVFISYHHENDQDYKESLLNANEKYDLFDASVDTGDIDDDLPDETIRKIIRDDYLRDSTVTILLVGVETKKESTLTGRSIPACMMARLIKNQECLLSTFLQQVVLFVQPHMVKKKNQFIHLMPIGQQ